MGSNPILAANDLQHQHSTPVEPTRGSHGDGGLTAEATVWAAAETAAGSVASQ
jgi:hypothetical protein